MATTSTSSKRSSSNRRRAGTGPTATRPAATRRTAPRRTAPSRATSASTGPQAVIDQAQALAERAVLIPVGASLLARENLVSRAQGMANRFGNRTAMQRELNRFEERGASARNRFERQVRRTRTKFERELRQRRASVEKTFDDNRRRIERDLRSARDDFGKQSSTVSARTQRLVAEASGRIGSIA
jgi:hypothetical protein